MLVIPWLGPQHAQQLLIAFRRPSPLVDAGAASAVARRRFDRSPPAPSPSCRRALLIASVPDVPDKLIAYGRRLLLSEERKSPLSRRRTRVVDRGDRAGRGPFVPRQRQDRGLDRRATCGCNGCSAISRRCCIRSRTRCSSSAAAPASRPARSSLYPGVERIVICEIEPLIPPVIGPYFSQAELRRAARPARQIVYDDARHYILTTHEKFDIITSDPIHPWVKGAATLYTEGILRAVPRASESRRRDHPMGAALREHYGGGEERNRDLLRGLSRRHDLEQRAARAGLRRCFVRTSNSRRCRYRCS